MDGPTLQFLDDTGRRIRFDLESTRPLSLEQLDQAGDGRSNEFDFEFVARDLIIGDEPQPGRSRVEGPISFPEPVSVFALVPNGWLPPSLVVPPRFLVDRSVLSMLRRLNQGTNRPDAGAVQWWLERLPTNDPWLNPLPCAFEGDRQATPTFAQFVASFEEARREVATAIPRARRGALTQDDLRGLHEFVLAVGQYISVEVGFLVEAVPAVIERRPKDQLQTIQTKIIELARGRGVRPGSLALVAVLSCLYDDASFALARGVIHPTAGYDAAKAYNALSDLRLIELTAASGSVPSVGAQSLLTRDRALAQLWCALRPSFRGWGNPGANIGCHLDPRLFPRLPEAHLETLNEAIQFK